MVLAGSGFGFRAVGAARAQFVGLTWFAVLLGVVAVVALLDVSRTLVRERVGRWRLAALPVIEEHGPAVRTIQRCGHARRG